MITTDLGAATAYAEAVKQGYKGTREDFGKLLAEFSEKMIRQIALKTPPKVEPKVDNPRALPGCFNLVAIGYPSSVVATDAGVPGVLSRIAEIDPP